MSDLKPCPCCGGRAEPKEVLMYLDTAYRIKCTKCGMQTPFFMVDHPSFNANGLDELTRYTKEQAIHKAAEIWNKRYKEDV